MTGRSRPGPRLVASTGALLTTPLGWVMDAVAEAGFSAIEVLLGHDPETRDPDKVLGFARQAGLDVPVVHGPYMLLLRRVLGTDYVEKTRRSVELARAMGAGLLVAHAPFRWEHAARRWAELQADDEAREHGVRFGMENLFPVAGQTFSSVVTPAQLEAFNHVVFDTSHFGVAGIELFDAWEALAGRVAHRHVSDYLGHGRDSHAPIGTGVLPLEAFLAHVGRSGWVGTVTLELDCRPFLDTRDSLVGFLAGEREKARLLLDGQALPAIAPTAGEPGR
ncbi:MAG: sugar phosphate isomerase/epimerase [Actinobacteria bacterium]|nr:sugar phosphate isomerase/epimerase [Actinomycetota bacterium]